MSRCIICLVLLILLSCNQLQSQPGFIKGLVVNENDKPVTGASVIIRKSDSGQVISFRLTKADGIFIIDFNPLPEYDYFLEVRHISYQDIIKRPGASTGDTLMYIQMHPRTVELKEVIIKREPPVVIKSDTVQFNAGSFRNAETRKLEDLLKNINGFSVDPSGRISFNGKAVEKVLIEGDDLSDKGYRMITRNLNAEVIDKVQVIDNYNDNRLMRNVTKSDKVGINIKMVSGIRNRVSGSITAGLSAEDRFLAEGSLIYTGKPVKVLSFINANNIAEDPSGNVRYYYSQEGDREDYQEKGGPDYSILSSGSIFPPDISDRYRQDNRDASSSLMSSWKPGDHIKIKAMIGADWLSLSRNAGAQNNIFINDTDNWTTGNVMQEKFTAEDKLASFSFHRDALKNHVSHVDFDLGAGRQKSVFRNLSSGSLVDTLSEKLTDQNKFFHFRWEESFLLKGKKVFTSSLEMHREKLQQWLNNESNRFTELFGVDSNYSVSTQLLDGNHFNGELNSGISGVLKKLQYQAGIRLGQQVSDYSSASRFTSYSDPHDYIDTGEQSLRVSLNQGFIFMNVGTKTGVRGFISLRSLAGYASLKQAGRIDHYPECKIEWKYLHAISPLKSFQLKYTFSAAFGNYHRLFPSWLISGNGNVLIGSGFGGTTGFHTWKTGYNATNIYKNSQWNVSLSYTRASRQYNSSMSSNPSYTISKYEPFNNNSGFLAAVTAEKYISSIKSKLGCSVSLSRYGNTYAVNGETGYSQGSNFSAEVRWSTGISLPVNLESKVRVSWSGGRWKEEQPNSNWQYSVSQKLKVSGGKKAYAALVWNFYVLAAGNTFHGLDAFVNFRINQTWKMSLIGSNLLNSAYIREKTVMSYANAVSSFELVRRYILVRAEVRL